MDHHSAKMQLHDAQDDIEPLHARSNGMWEAHELSYLKRRYSEATERRKNELTRTGSRRSNGPPKGWARMAYEIKKFWRDQIAIVVDSKWMRDHLALERTFLSYLKTSQALSLLGIIIAQVFRIHHSHSPDPVLGYYAVGKSLAAICQCLAVFTILLGAYRCWKVQNAMVRGYGVAGGLELSFIALGSMLLCVAIFALCIAIGVRRDSDGT